ncbi:hypothetical protein [Brevundimonas olei]|uniref:hypothetical protein n=1 Tax=Brevundimonas olei TaxID=657642 RepID=UPI0031D92219
MSLEPGHYITLAIAAVGFITWLVRLEGRVNALKAKEAGHDATRDEVIRLQEQVKFLTSAIQDLAGSMRPAARRRIAE